MKKLRVAVLMGGPGSEREVSINSGKNVLAAFRAKENLQRYVAVPLEIRDPKKVLSQLAKAKPDVAFSVVHGTFGEDGTLQALLEVAHIPYVGSRVLSSALCMDKLLASELVQQQGILVPKVLAPRSSGKFRSVVVKPRASGSSVGISIVRKASELAAAIKVAKKEGEPLVQEFVAGTELTCGVLEFEEGKAFALPVTEIIPQKKNGSKFFDYKAKYSKGGSQEITPARISSKLTREIQRAALVAHKALNCRHISRSDFIVKMIGHSMSNQKYEVYYLETNTLPGMTNTSLIPQAARAAGLEMPELVHKLTQAALS